MNFLRLTSALELLIAIHGFRVQPQPVQPQQGGNGHPASPACLLGSGFGLLRGCQYPEAMQPVPDCNNANFDQACYQVDPAEVVSGYMRDVRSTNDYSSLTRSVTEAEFGGYGVTVSASFSYMKSSEVTEESIAFFIGASGKTQTRTIQRPVAMRLTSAAKEILRQDPRQFITRHGLRYIHSITYGGSFLGSVTLNSRETKDDRDIQAFANVSVNKGLWSVGGSQDFQNTLSEVSRNVSVFINAKWVGGSDIQQDYQTPETLSNMFQDWDRSWRASPSPLTVQTRRWIDSAEVQEVVNTMSAENKELFNVPDLTQAIQREISDENARIVLTDTSLRKALTWNEIRDDGATQACLNGLSRDVSAKLMRIDLLDEVAVLTIQQQWLAGDYSWFDAASLQARYLSCVEGVVVTDPPTPAPTPAPTQRTCTSNKKNPCTAHPIDWYQPSCSNRHGSGYVKVGWEHCSAVFGGRYLCRRTWTCSQSWNGGDCCR